MQINLSDDVVTTYTNTTGKKDKVVEITVPDDLQYDIPNGALLVMDLRDGSDAKLPADTKVFVGAKPPIYDFPRGVDKKSYRVYNQLSVAEQYDEEKNIQAKLRIKGGGLSLPEGNKLSIWVKSSAEIDFTNSVLELNDVDELSM